MRFPGWQERLRATLLDARGRPFEWGQHDCCLFAANCLEAITTLDFANEYRGRYRSRLGAYRVLKRICGGGVEDAAARALGAPRKHALLAVFGDIASVEGPEGLSLGIVLGERIAVAGPTGMVLMPIRHARQSWSV